MKKRVFFISTIALGLSLFPVTNSHAKKGAKPPQNHAATNKAVPKTKLQNPKLSKSAHNKTANKAVGQFRSVRNNLARERKLALQKHTNAERNVQRTRETERARKDVHDAALGAALKRVPGNRPEGVSLTDYAKRDRGVRDAAKLLQTATARRTKAEATFSQTRTGLREANRQVRAANRTLSLAKKSNWINAHRVAGRAKPSIPATAPRKISYNFTPQGPTPKGPTLQGAGAPRKGILKTSPRK